MRPSEINIGDKVRISVNELHCPLVIGDEGVVEKIDLDGTAKVVVQTPGGVKRGWCWINKLEYLGSNLPTKKKKVFTARQVKSLFNRYHRRFLNTRTSTLHKQWLKDNIDE